MKVCQQDEDSDSIVLLLRAITAAGMLEEPDMVSWALTVKLDLEGSMSTE